MILGLRVAPKEKTILSSVEMIFGRSLRLPAEFITSTIKVKYESEYVHKVRAEIRKIRSTKFFIHPQLCICKRAYVKFDRIKKTLETSY